MNGINHKRIAGKSLHYLSEPVRKFWQPQELLEDASNFPDIFCRLYTEISGLERVHHDPLQRHTRQLSHKFGRSPA